MDEMKQSEGNPHTKGQRKQKGRQIVAKQIKAAVKPGGHLLIVDHAAAAGSGNSAAQDLHRIDEEFAKRDIESHGFEIEKTWDGYRNPDDDPSKLVFDPAVRGKTDRFVHLYRRI